MSQTKKRAAGDSPSKAGFVRSMPADMPPKEVSEKAKEAGIILSPKNISTIRAKDRARGKGAPKASSPKKGTPKKGRTKTAFVLEFPFDLHARDVVAKAKSQGIVLTEKHVAAIRSIAKKKTRLGGKKKVSIASIKSAVVLPKGASRLSPDDLLRAAVLAVGLPRATELVAEENRKLRLLLEG
jgi:hypothetical protein